MAFISVEATIAAPAEEVWAQIADIGSHVRWMDDAVAIRFTSPAHAGVGATFECDTKVGPVRLTDRMVVTDWDPPTVMGIRHVGVVTGRGRFVLEPVPGGTRFTWEEDLDFPVRIGGRVGEALAVPLLRRVWRRNLANLKRLVEGRPAV